MALDNKNIFVKDFQDLVARRSYNITNEDNINELTTFVKNITAAGNVRFGCDSGNDDLAMTCINSTTIFKTNFYIEGVQEIFEKMDITFKNYVNECLRNLDYSESVDYISFSRVMNRAQKGNWRN